MEQPPVMEPKEKVIPKSTENLTSEEIGKQIEKDTVIENKEKKIEEVKKSIFSKMNPFKKKELTPEEKQLKLEQRMAKWTPKHKAAMNFLSAVKPGWFDKMGEAQVNKVEQFVSSPTDAGFNSISYNKEENRYSAAGKKEVTSILD